MKLRNILQKTAIVALMCAIISQPISAETAENSENETILSTQAQFSADEYGNYISAVSRKKFTDKKIVLNFENSTSDAKSNINNKVCNVLNNESKEINYAFSVEESGLYNISVTYYDLLDSALSLKAGFYIDGSALYRELKNVSFSKIYTSGSETIEKDNVGNEIKPTQSAVQRFNNRWVESETGKFSEPYAVYLEKGTHRLNVKKVLGSMAIEQILFAAHQTPISYEEYINKYSEYGKSGNDSFLIEAENCIEASDSTLGAAINSTNAGMSPSSSTLRRVNEFGGGYWKTNGQWGSWEVPENFKAGLYKISFRAKQTGSVGVSSYRKLYVNGEIPFSEAQDIEFEYDTKWQIKTFGNENPYYVYIEPGDIITLEATTGKMADVLNDIDSTLNNLNEIYQSIIIVTGISPDTNRDYNLKTAVPGLIENISEASKQIDIISNKISSIMGENNTKVFSLKRFSDTLKKYVANYRLIVKELDDFKDLIDSFAAQTYDFNSMPLELDWILLSKDDAKIPNANVGFIKSLSFEIERFIYTFSSDYQQKNISNAESVTVWSSLGRDQAQAVKNIIDNDFAAKTGINVELKITTTSLAEAVLSGKEPDVSLSVAQDVPINMALRGQALDLTPYLNNDSDNSLSKICESAWIPFQYEGGTYAIPVSQDYYMMFYREDVLSKLSVKLPETWDELYKTIRELKKNNLLVGVKESDSASAGISSAIPIFDMFLYQNGGTYFNDEMTATAFETETAKNAFKSWVELYRDYGLLTDFNILTRFRSGEMPIVLTKYSFYLTLSATAQEISGRWGMTLIPGTLMQDGTINRTQTASVNGVMIMKGAEKRGVANEAFEFAKWWASSDTQLKYSTSMESIQGIAGRQLPANVETFESLNWTDSEKEILNEQRKWVIAVNQIPGTYIINRSLTNALRTSYASTVVDPLRQLNIQNSIINTELVRKRAEFVESN